MFQHYALLSYALTCALLIRRRSRSAWQTGDALGLRERGLWSGGGGGGAGAGAGGGGGDGGGGSIQPLLVFGACRGSDRGPLRPPPPLPRGRARARSGAFAAARSLPTKRAHPFCERLPGTYYACEQAYNCGFNGRTRHASESTRACPREPSQPQLHLHTRLSTGADDNEDRQVQKQMQVQAQTHHRHLPARKRSSAQARRRASAQARKYASTQ